jgi:hypothetical protein
VHQLKALKLTLPPGLIGNPQATPKRCSIIDVLGNACPLASRLGTLLPNYDEGLFGSGEVVAAIYNVTPERGYAAEFGVYLAALEKVALIYAKVGPAPDYRIQVTIPDIPNSGDIANSIATFFGDPATADGEPTPTAFLINPSDCSHGPFATEAQAESWDEQGQWVHASAPAPGVTGCDQLEFTPTIEALPTTNLADSPAGLDFNLKVPQGEDPKGLATPPLRDATVTLPAGLSANPGLADGLQGCTEAQIALDTTEPATCPLASQIGTAEVTTPLLEEPVQGQVFLGAPECSPCTEEDAQDGRMLKLYIQALQPQTGIDVKLAGKTSANPATGRLTTTFEDNPQFPFSDLQLHLKQGPRAALRTPATCGTYTTTTHLRPWSAPETPDADPSSSFAVTSTPSGASCATDPAKAPLSPALQAGTLNPLAGTFSPFTMKLTRGDGEQELSSLEVTTPPGIAADLRGVPYCPEAALAAAAKSSGHAEQSSPSCPAASQVGTATVGAGAGPSPYHVSGKVYLAGPYKGAPLSLAVVTPALAGPFDLGTVVVRAATYVDPSDAHLHVVSDPLPKILDGIPLDIRDVRVNVDRPNFTTNPTYCEPMSIFADVFGTAGAAARVSNPFQVGGCKGLGFQPKLSLRLKGGTKRGDTPAFTATLTARPGDANIGRAAVTLPHSEFLDNAHIKTICTRVQFNEGAGNGASCPAGSVYGFAKATSPLLEAPLQGPVYLRSSSHQLPDLVAALGGQIEVDLAGRVDSVNGGIRNTFEVVPDAPVTKFTLSMKGGAKGLLENSTDLCSSTHRATVLLTGQNNRTLATNPELIAQGCAKQAKKHHKKRGAHRRKHHR